MSESVALGSPSAGGGLALEYFAPGSRRVDREGLGRLVPPLPGPEHVVDEAMVKEEDGIEPGGVVLAHVAVRAGDRREIALARIVEAADREMHHVMRLFERHGLRVGLIAGRRGVREQRVVRRVEALHELVLDLDHPLAADPDLAAQPGGDVVVEITDVLLVVGELRVVRRRRRLVRRRAEEARERIAHGLVSGRLAVDDRVVLHLIDDRDRQREGAQRIGDRYPIEHESLVCERVGNAVLLRICAAFVPERQLHVGAPRNALQRLLEPKEIGAVPAREQDRAVLAITAPPRRIGLARAAERLAVIAADDEERVRVGRGQLLDAFPRPHQGFERRLVAAVVVFLQVGNRAAHAKSHVAIPFRIPC